MFASIIENRRKFKALVHGLREAGELNEANLRVILRRRVIPNFLFFGVFGAALYCLLVFAAFISFWLVPSEQDHEVTLIQAIVPFVMGLGIFWLCLNSTRGFVKEELRIVNLMTHGVRTQGIVNVFELQVQTGFPYYVEYTFYNDDKKKISNSQRVPWKYVLLKHKAGEEIMVIYNPDDPNDNVCNPDWALDEYDLKLPQQ